MSPILIVLPILVVLMFGLGLGFQWCEVVALARQPRALAIGLGAQIILLPLLALGLALVFRPEAYFFMGLVLIACSPGGSSSNIFSLLAKGDVALSVSLTLLSSVITVFTIPPIMLYAAHLAGLAPSDPMHLPAFRLLLQNVVLVLLPIVLGMLFRQYAPHSAQAVKRVLDKIAFPALLVLASIFFVEHRSTITQYFGTLIVPVTALILSAILLASLLARAGRLVVTQRRTIVIEVGMQNAAQAIAVASSPFVLNNEIVAIPAILYALVMNVVLLLYISPYVPIFSWKRA